MFGSGLEECSVVLKWGKSHPWYLQILPSSWVSPDCGVGLPRGEILAAESSSHLLLIGKNPINRAVKPRPWEGKFMQRSSDSEWGKSHSGVSWMPIGKPALSPLSGENHIPRCTVQGLDVIVKMCT